MILSNLDEALDSPYRYAQAVPQDKRTWEPDGDRYEMMAERAQWDTLEKCEAETRARLAKLRKTIETFPDEDMEATLFLFFTMKDHPYWDIMMYPYWNMVWHTGQIAYIQTMLGDRDMY